MPDPTQTAAKEITMPVGIVLTRRPGVTKWARHSWHPSAVLPGAPPASWKLLHRDGETCEYHAATLPLTLHRADVEAYKVSLTMTPPAVFVILRREDDGAQDVSVHAITASAYEAQDYTDSGEDIVEPVAMPPGLIAWVRDFTDAHFVETPFVKRRRDRQKTDGAQAGIGDARIRQTADVYRAPGAQKPDKDTT